jgi:hypothetical protein
MIMYKLPNTRPDGTLSPGVIKLDTMTWIPEDPANIMYQEYLLWLEEGNAPEPGEVVRPDYRSLRQAEYPSIGDQLDALFHAGLMPLELAIKIQAIKAKYPKV